MQGANGSRKGNRISERKGVMRSLQPVPTIPLVHYLPSYPAPAYMVKVCGAPRRQVVALMGIVRRIKSLVVFPAFASNSMDETGRTTSHNSSHCIFCLQEVVFELGAAADRMWNHRPKVYRGDISLVHLALAILEERRCTHYGGVCQINVLV